jgi:hypothetical protein
LRERREPGRDPDFLLDGKRSRSWISHRKWRPGLCLKGQLWPVVGNLQNFLFNFCDARLDGRFDRWNSGSRLSWSFREE